MWKKLNDYNCQQQQQNAQKFNFISNSLNLQQIIFAWLDYEKFMYRRVRIRFIAFSFAVTWLNGGLHAYGSEACFLKRNELD